MAARHLPSKGSKPDKLMADALRVALHREALDGDGKPTKRLYQIAERLVQKAAEGDIAAIREVFDRIDGRIVHGQVAGGGGPILVQVNTGIIREGDGSWPSAIEDRPAPDLEDRDASCNGPFD